MVGAVARLQVAPWGWMSLPGAGGHFLGLERQGLVIPQLFATGWQSELGLSPVLWRLLFTLPCR